jgi:hypothetical protein
MLYISPLFSLDDPSKNFGYADDVAKLEISSSLTENAQKLSSRLEQALAWGREEGITFDLWEGRRSRFRDDESYQFSRIESWVAIMAFASITNELTSFSTTETPFRLAALSSGDSGQGRHKRGLF